MFGIYRCLPLRLAGHGLRRLWDRGRANPDGTNKRFKFENNLV